MIICGWSHRWTRNWIWRAFLFCFAIISLIANNETISLHILLALWDVLRKVPCQTCNGLSQHQVFLFQKHKNPFSLDSFAVARASISSHRDDGNVHFVIYLFLLFFHTKNSNLDMFSIRTSVRVSKSTARWRGGGVLKTYSTFRENSARVLVKFNPDKGKTLSRMCAI